MNLQPLTPATDGAALAELASAADARGARPAGAIPASVDGLLDAAAPPGIASAKTSASASSATRKKSGTGYAKAKSSSSSTTKKASTTSKATTASVPKDLAFLSDPKLSAEEKLFRFMQYFAAKYDEQLDAKMKEIAAKQGASKSSGTTSSSGTTATKKKKKGLLSQIGSALKKLPVVGAAVGLLQTKEIAALLKQISGPVLAAGATAFGLPMLAPVLLKAGPELAGALTAVAKELDDSGEAKVATAQKASTSKASSSSSASSTSSSSSASGAGAELSTADSMALQRIQEKQKEMFSLVSNMLRAMHDTKMAVINNVRS